MGDEEDPFAAMEAMLGGGGDAAEEEPAEEDDEEVSLSLPPSLSLSLSVPVSYGVAGSRSLWTMTSTPWMIC
jgi:hypothetical protein